MRQLFLLITLSILIFSCKKDDAPAPTIFEGFSNKSFYDTSLAKVLINNSWTTNDYYHGNQDRLYFRGDGSLYVMSNYDLNRNYEYYGKFDLTGHYIYTEHYGEYNIDIVYPTSIKARRYTFGKVDTVYFYKDPSLVKQ
jgi:hypothetical protein